MKKTFIFFMVFFVFPFSYGENPYENMPHSLKEKIARVLKKRFNPLRDIKKQALPTEKQKGRLGTTAKKIATSHPVRHTASLLAFILTVSCVETVRQKLYFSRISGTEPSYDEIRELIVEITGELLDEGHLWGGVLGAGAVNAATKNILSPITQPKINLNDKKIKRSLKIIISSTVATFVTFFGWEFGQRLWEEALFQVELKDRELAKKLWSNLGKGITDVLKGEDSESLRVLGIMMKNMYNVMITNPELRERWVYNTWRLHFTSGEFVTFVGSLSAATATGMIIFPGAGFLAGLGFAISGAVFFLFIPDSIKQRITETTRKTRENVGFQRLLTLEKQIRNFTSRLNTANFKDKTLDNILEFIKRRKSIREDIFNVYIESYFSNVLKLRHLKFIQYTLATTLDAPILTNDILDGFLFSKKDMLAFVEGKEKFTITNKKRAEFTVELRKTEDEIRRTFDLISKDDKFFNHFYSQELYKISFLISNVLERTKSSDIKVQALEKFKKESEKIKIGLRKLELISKTIGETSTKLLSKESFSEDEVSNTLYNIEVIVQGFYHVPYTEDESIQLHDEAMQIMEEDVSNFSYLPFQKPSRSTPLSFLRISSQMK